MPVKIDNVLSWGSDVEDATIDQAQKTARLPFVDGHVALMPDAHVGIGSTVGSVIPTRGAIIPAAIGVDIGCGMIATELKLSADELPDDLVPFLHSLTKAVPAGVGKGHDESDSKPRGSLLSKTIDIPSAVVSNTKLLKRAILQMGSLGSGNHFVELCLDERDQVWLVLHSGSRGVGNELAKIHIEGAKDLMKKYFIQLEDKDLAYLVEGTEEFQEYIHAMNWAQNYAMENRAVMMLSALDQFDKFMGRIVEHVQVINCHHNFTERENHGGKNLWITRKGAIRSREGDMGIIPGSMGTRSYIVEGLGNESSYHSSSHGAGRRMSRSAARKKLTLESFEEAMVGKVWLHEQADALLDEHPDSYKDIDQVMDDQRDLVKVHHVLRQILNYKGL